MDGLKRQLLLLAPTNSLAVETVHPRPPALEAVSRPPAPGSGFRV